MYWKGKSNGVRASRGTFITFLKNKPPLQTSLYATVHKKRIIKLIIRKIIPIHNNPLVYQTVKAEMKSNILQLNWGEEQSI